MDTTVSISQNLFLSRVEDFLTCPRKGYYTQVLGLREKLPSAQMELGNKVHEFLELAIKELNTEQIELPEHWSDELKEEFNMLTINLSEFIQASKLKFFISETPYKIDLVDISNTLNNLKHFKHWKIKPDLVFMDQQGLWMGELKTTSIQNKSRVLSYYSNSIQIFTYFTILKTILTNLTGIKLIIVTRATRYKPIEITTETILPTKHDIERAKKFITTASREVDEIVSKGEFPMYLNRCYSYFNKECPYTPLCIYNEHNKINEWFITINPEKHLEERS